MSMAYRGGDLELRVPHGFAARDHGNVGTEQAWLARALAGGEPYGGAGTTVWVLPALMTVLNRAYDLAVAHRASEVRLEHLVHALTLVDETAATLERHGVGVATLRRESAAAIAGQQPDGPLNGGSEPYTSQELIDTLRLAADSAYRRRSPTTTEDILAVLFDMKRDTSSRTLLARHRADWNLNAPPEPRERIRVSAGSHIISEGAMPRAEPHTMTDSFQNNRLDALERAMRELAGDVGGERRMLGELIAEFQRGGSQRSEPNGGRTTSTLDRLSSLEQAILENRTAGRSTSPNVAEAQLSAEAQERLSRVERSVEAKFSELARTWTLLGERLQSIEDLMLDERPATAELPESLNRKLDTIDHLDGKLKALELSVGLVLDQLGLLDRRLDEPSSALGEIDLTPVSARLGEIEHLLKTAGGSITVDLDPIDARLKEIENRTGDAALYIEGFSERMDAIESQIDGQRAGLAQTSATIGSEIKALAATLSAQRANHERMESVLGDRMQSLLGAMERQRGEWGTAVSVPIQREIERFQALVGAASQTRDHEAAQMAERLGGIEQGVARVLAQPAEDVRVAQLIQLAHNQAAQIRELQDALVTVNANQQTIAGSLDQWRTENSGDLGIIANRLQVIEGVSRQPAEMLAKLSTDVGVLSQAMIERQEKRSRFKMWLFGTEDWIGAGWRRADKSA